jgi:hypothetical protein
MTPPPAPFEALRQYACEAIAQLLREMADQQVRYLIPADDALALVEQVARVKGTSAWDIWEDWALRHALPVHELVRQSQTRPLTAADRVILKARLRDLFGYALLGLILTEKDQNFT